MNQTWCYLVPTLIESNKVRRLYGSHGIPPLWGGFGAFQRLCRPEEWASEFPSAPAANPSPSSYLENIPTELLEMIIEPLEPACTMAVGLCSQRLWARVTSIIQKNSRGPYMMSSWAGEPLICAGTLLRDLPRPICDLYPRFDVGIRRTSSCSCCLYARTPANVWTRGAANYAEERPKLQDAYFWYFARYITSIGTPKDLRSWLKSCIRPRPSLDHPAHDTRPWYLRNLTTREYVSMELAHFPRNDVLNSVSITLKGRRGATVDTILTRHILWTDRNELYLNAENEIADRWGGLSPIINHRGDWAGHRFDIVHQSHFLEEHPRWIDVTDRMAEEDDVWTSAFSQFKFGKGFETGRKRLIKSFITAEQVQEVQAQAQVNAEFHAHDHARQIGSTEAPKSRGVRLRLSNGFERILSWFR
ncbi:hypothetical protein FZEAL_1185 [Fusarium zealandicum]|uniref:F-box domain-containing protein n=1 Tax=Fusarium zealandicum TaxID=1053134 RepID=A0A8H4UTS0_9HYPO|nr:hypothetical protein FZEAL_1185 [Fusarium zealandicum]